MKHRIAALALSLAIALSLAAARPDPKKALAGIDALIERELAAQKIPGAAVG